MIGLPDRDEVHPIGGDLCHMQGQIDGLGPAVDEKYRVQFRRGECGEPLGEFNDGSIVETGVGIEFAHLSVDCVGKSWISMADDRDIVDHVQIRPGVRVDEMTSPPTLDLHWLGVVMLLETSEHQVSPAEQLGGLLHGNPHIGTDQW